MRSMRKREAPGKNRECRGRPRSKFAKWLAAPVLAVGMLFGGCNMAQSPGQQQNPDAGPQCETSSYQKQVNDSTTQNVEQTWCDGVLEMETSSFMPPLQNSTERQALDLVDQEHVLLNSEPTMVLLASEALRVTLSPGESVDYHGYKLAVESIDDGKVTITIKEGGQTLEEAELEIGLTWYAFHLGGDEGIMLDLYSATDPAEISLFHARISDGLFVGSHDVGDDSFLALSSGGILLSPEGQFDVEASWEGGRLVGWTLTRPD